MKIKVKLFTGFKKKGFKVICNNDKCFMVNIFGTALFVEK